MKSGVRGTQECEQSSSKPERVAGCPHAGDEAVQRDVARVTSDAGNAHEAE